MTIPAQSAVDEDAAPTTGLDPDTAADAAGETDASTAPNAAPESDPGTRGGTRSVAEDQVDTEANGNRGAAPGERTVLDGPALENQEMHRATDDLRSSEDKIAAAREFADELARTQPEDG
jgi:hypothetical protein